MAEAINRRDAIKIGIGAAALTAGALSVQAADAPAAKPRRPLKKSFFGEAKKGQWAAWFKMLKEVGFDGVQLNTPGPDIAEVIEATKQTGVVVESVCDSQHWRLLLSDADPSIRKAGVDALLQSIKDCKALGASTVLLVPGRVDEKTAYDDCYKRSQEEIRKALPLAKELGVNIAIENVWNGFHLSPLEAARYVDEFESPNVGWWFDIGNVMHFGWPEQWIKVLGKRTMKIHIKEYDRKKSDKQGKWAGFSTELTEGSNNWAAIMKALDDAGYTKEGNWATIEMGGGDAARMKKLSDQLDRILEA